MKRITVHISIHLYIHILFLLGFTTITSPLSPHLPFSFPPSFVIRFSLLIDSTNKKKYLFLFMYKAIHILSPIIATWDSPSFSCSKEWFNPCRSHHVEYRKTLYLFNTAIRMQLQQDSRGFMCMYAYRMSQLGDAFMIQKDKDHHCFFSCSFLSCILHFSFSLLYYHRHQG